ncbi:hypothetical protein [Allocoleopsis sp.]
MTLPESSKFLACRLTRVLFGGMDEIASILSLAIALLRKTSSLFTTKTV